MSGHWFEWVRVGAYRHCYVCGCGWRSGEVENGSAAAGAELVRHLAAVARGGVSG